MNRTAKENNWIFEKWGWIAFLAAVAFLLFPLRSEARVKAPEMECHAYVVMDAGSGEVLFGQDEDKMIYPASTAKLMTAIVCVENGDVNGKIKTKSEVVNGTTYGTYSLGIGSGVTYTFKDLLHMSLMSSAADATDSLAVGVFGSKSACVEAMNAKCAELGLTQTSFDNPVGSDIGAGFNETYSTATEMALITRYAMSIPLIRSTVAKAHYDVTSGLELSINTTNWFLRGLAYYDEDTYTIIGSKSGTTNAAGNVFIATAIDDEGHEVICAYFGNVSKESTFSSIRKLLDYTFEKYEKGKLELTKSNYDVRYSEDEELQEVYNEYASLNCYPGNNNGTFGSNKAITRKELAKMLRGINNLSGSAVLKTFVQGNTDGKGKVTVARLAELINDLYPEHLSDEKVEELLEGTTNTENLSDDEKEAFALLIKNGLAIDDSFKNAAQIVTRKQALLFADALSDYQVKYYASHVVVTFDIQMITVQTESTEEEAGETTVAEDSTTETTAAGEEAAQTTTAEKSTVETTAEEGSDESTATEESTLTYPTLLCGDWLSGFNKKWLEYLTQQAS
ncbi:MAG: D-alanyl-D-alanine carboxypeptidase [Clostridiales bacterium]|nr:D-alanyl-D-alanine carboxypeptidase [Clostridiales bacterium]